MHSNLWWIIVWFANCSFSTCVYQVQWISICIFGKNACHLLVITPRGVLQHRCPFNRLYKQSYTYIALFHPSADDEMGQSLLGTARGRHTWRRVNMMCHTQCGVGSSHGGKSVLWGVLYMFTPIDAPRILVHI